jgi:hypothetical protein
VEEEEVKKAISAVLVPLLLTLILPVVSQTLASSQEDMWASYPRPENVPSESMPENFTTEDYLNTTNPYSDYVDTQGVLDEVDDSEGSNPLYVLVFGDEEERQITRYVGILDPYPFNWTGWAELQIERGDESLVANFGIDIRILGFEEWDSDDNAVTLDPL